MRWFWKKMSIFEIVCKLRKKIRLTETQWSHIKYRHPELENQIEKISMTLESPEIICYSSKEELYHYYRHFTGTPVSEKYLLVVVKHLNDEGFVVTGFFVSKIKKVEKEVIYGKENYNKL